LGEVPGFRQAVRGRISALSPQTTAGQRPKAGSREPTADPKPYLAAAAIVIIAAAILYSMGRVPICACGYVKAWHGVVFSSENSQHLSDWYTYSHVIHGFGFYWLAWLAGRRFGWSQGLRFALAVFVEAAWEVLENTPMVIDRYRATTIALDYYGDSIINSVADIGAMVLGFLLAARLPVALTIILTVVMEVGVAWVIRDNLLLNIIQLVYPMEFILRWQQGG
jgi:hypothetical protein